MMNPKERNRLLKRALEDVCRRPHAFVPRQMQTEFRSQVEEQAYALLDEGRLPLALCQEAVAREAELVAGSVRARFRRTLDESVLWLALATGQLQGVVAREVELAFHAVLNRDWDPHIESSAEFTRSWVRQLAPQRFRTAASRFNIVLPHQHAWHGAEWPAYYLEWRRHTKLQQQLLLCAVQDPVDAASIAALAEAGRLPLIAANKADQLRLEFAHRTLLCYGRLVSE